MLRIPLRRNSDKIMQILQTARTAKVTFVFLVTLTGASLLATQPASNPRPGFWVTDGPVFTLAQTNQIAFVGGAFEYVGPNASAGVPVEPVRHSVKPGAGLWRHHL